MTPERSFRKQARRVLLAGLLAVGLGVLTADQKPASPPQAAASSADLQQPSPDITRPAFDIAPPFSNPESAGISKRLFGAVGHAWWMDLNIPQFLNRYKDLRTTDVRIALDWKRFEPREGQYDFSIYDRVLPSLNSAGIEVTGNFVTVPAWASSNPQNCLRDQIRFCDLPANREPQLRMAARAAMNRYPFIRNWEVGNEPEMWQYLGRNPADYLRIFRAFYIEAKSANPNNQVAAATLLGWRYLDELYRLAPEKPWDAVTFHPYGGGAADGQVKPEDRATDDPGTNLRTAEIDRIYAGMVSKGDEYKKIWITEYGWERPPVEQAHLLRITLPWMSSRSFIERAHLHAPYDAVKDDGTEELYGLTTRNPRGPFTPQTILVPKQPYYDEFKNTPRLPY